jgi:hypothetical protein
MDTGWTASPLGGVPLQEVAMTSKRDFTDEE